MASDQGNNGNGSRDRESSSKVTAIPDQVRILTGQVLASQQAQSAIQQTQEVMMEALKALQQNLAASHPSTSTIPSSTPEDLNPTPKNLKRHLGVPQTMLSQVNLMALNFSPSRTPTTHQTSANPSQITSFPEQRTPANPTPPTFPRALVHPASITYT